MHNDSQRSLGSRHFGGIVSTVCLTFYLALTILYSGYFISICNLETEAQNAHIICPKLVG